MARLALLIVCSAILFASNYVDSQGIGAKVETFSPIESKLENKTVSKNLTKTIVDEKKDDKNNSKNLTKEEIKPKSRIARQAILPAQPISILYHLGKRVNGDRLLASVPVVQQWTELQNITQTLNYPKNGTGGVITYVEVIVDQVSLWD